MEQLLVLSRRQVWLRCDLGGRAREGASAEGQRKRKRAAPRTECPFRLYGRLHASTGRWKLRALHAQHNHAVAGGADEIAAHPVARRLSLEQKLVVQELTERGARPASIVDRLRDLFPDKPIKVQDIYNTRNFIQRERKAGRVPFRKPDGWTPPSPRQRTSTDLVDAASSSGSSADDATAVQLDLPAARPAAAVSHTAESTQERLRLALRRASREFPDWASQQQGFFLLSLEHLLDACSESQRLFAHNSGAQTTAAVPEEVTPSLIALAPPGDSETDHDDVPGGLGVPGVTL